MAVRKYTPADVIAALVGRRWLVVVPFAIGLALAPLLARLAPARYKSEALIVVVPQQVPSDYVKPTVAETVADRLPSITEQILSRSRLELIIQEMNLYPAARNRLPMEDVVRQMRTDVQTTPVGREVNSFRISYTSDQPETARKVTARLADLYVQQNTEDRKNQADQTSEFLDAQLAEAKKNLVDQEKKLEEYRKTHSGQLPSQLQGNLQAIQNANLQMQALNDATNRAQERRLLIERQIADALAVPLPEPAATPASPDAPPIPSTARRLEIAQAQLTLLLQRNTPAHPDVIAMERMIEDLTARLKAEGSGAEPAEDAARTPTAAEIAQQKRVRDLQSELAVIDFQLAANRTEDTRIKQQIADLQAKVDAVPSRESELVELTRDYSTLQTAYADLLMKRQDSAIAANLERRRIGELFTLVDEARRPERPDNQRMRLAIVASGAVAGLVLGLALVGFLEYRDSSFRAADEVLAALEIPVLASIPIMKSDRETRAATRRLRLQDAAGTAVVVAAAAVVIVWRLGSGGW